MKNWMFANPSYLKKVNTSLMFALLFLMSGAQLRANAYVDLSQTFLERLQSGTSADDIAAQYEQFTIEELEGGLNERSEKLAFWINTYNAFIIYTLQKDPSLFEDRGKFFTQPRLRIAGHDFSFDNIEHDIIRNLRVKWGLGYLQKWFVADHLRKLRVKKREPRIHFALNCGANSCPPVAIYDDEALETQLTKGTQQYLESVTTAENNTVTTTPLFSWFRGDFSGKRGIKKMLLHYGLIESTEGVELKFGPYDWTLNIDNFKDL